MTPKKANKLNSFALIVTGITSTFVIGMTIWLTVLLSDGERWCDIATNGCLGLLQTLIDALALNSHIALGVIALCLGVLMVLVVAQGNLSFKGGPTGVDFTVSPQEAEGPRPSTDVTVNVGVDNQQDAGEQPISSGSIN